MRALNGPFACAYLEEHAPALLSDQGRVGESKYKILVQAIVADIEKKLLRAEYKRRQAPPGVKLGARNFGRDRRYPITNAFHTGK